MRFSRRNRGPLAWARRSKSRSQDQDDAQEFGPVESEEREALLSSGGASAEDPVDPPEDNGFDHEEATQHILSALGRFHRQVTKAKVGAAQELWTDECMNELVTAAEVAVREGWRETVTVLTETGRILQTYEDAGRASECVPFLSEAYDVLSLMVGDLIVGEVRPGVLAKWGECHARALHALNAAGLTLIDIDEGNGEMDDDYDAAPASGQPLNTIPFELPPLDDEYEEAPHMERAAAEAPTLETLPPMAEAEIARTEPINEALLAAEQEREYAAMADVPRLDPLDAAVASITGEEPAPLDPSEPELPVFDADEDIPAGTPEEDAAADDVPDTPAPAAEPAGDPEVVATLDSFCEGLARIDAAEGRDLTTVYAAMLDELAFLDKWAVNAECEQAQRLTRSMALLCQQVADGNAVPNDKFLELGYGFCEAYVEAKSGEASAVVDPWLEECSALYQRWTQPRHAEPEDIPAPAAEAVQDAEEIEAAPVAAAGTPAANDGSPETLLRAAQEAVAAGRLAEAKVLAMQAAAAFAKREAEQAQERLSTIERRINEGGILIETARGELHGAEEAVVDAEKQTREGESELTACGNRTREAQEHLETIQAEIADLDERIRQLQAQRDAAAERRAQADALLNEKRAEEAAAGSGLDARRAGEDDARNRLEEARQKVKNLERKRGELELEMERARDILARQLSSFEDIEQTITQLDSTDVTPSGESGELLF